MIDSISQLFEGAAAKWLSAVDAEPGRSNQHEIGGLPSVGFRAHLGEPAKDDVLRFDATMAYLGDDEDEPPEIVEDTVSWYDCRSKNPSRPPEYRLYYRSNAVTDRIAEGDLMVIAKARDGSLLIVFAPGESEVESQIRHVFGFGELGERFQAASMPASALTLPLKLLLEEIGVATIEPDDATADLEIVLERFPDRFPSTAEFSSLARELSRADPLGQPDDTLLAWMEREEALFRAYEREVVLERLEQGFHGDVDEFVRFSLSVHNRRKSRMGHAFENHLSALFNSHRLRFEKGGRKRVTENKSKPDFLFPGFSEYHDPAFPTSRLFLLGAKTTCKERWRQVLAEGKRLRTKYLATLEPGISETHTDEMRAQSLTLVVPSPVQGTYSESQRQDLLALDGFIERVKAEHYRG